ncbi:hypothetical protein [Pseudomonas sp. MPC6]|uniref:hypothetical protein n=1 Tax=unclassified Pseudomonas TaxID=196821 RepID=UPI0011108C81|nr:hypothetical protein [Pseudomonas sp. MPC6]QCY10046.1 hypothetical protein ELQ88_04185 [Pseudomonas sp. MPC6]
MERSDMVWLLGRRGMACLPSRSLEEKTLMWFPERSAICFAIGLGYFRKISPFALLLDISSILTKDA